MKCLVHHIPFIFHLYKNNSKLKSAWACINSMLKIIRICYSSKISEQDIIELEENVKCHLENMKECFGIDLKPKHHFMTHYSEIIRRWGPLCHMSTLRYEMKHKSLTGTMKNSNNFRNVTKSVTERFQKKNVIQEVYTDQIQHTKLQQFKSHYFEEYKHLLSDLNGSSIYSIKNVHFDSDYYEKGLVLKHNSNYLEIEYILYINEAFYFICRKYDCVGFNDFLVSLEITPSFPVEFSLMKHSELSYKKTHDKKMFGNKVFI